MIVRCTYTILSHAFENNSFSYLSSESKLCRKWNKDAIILIYKVDIMRVKILGLKKHHSAYVLTSKSKGKKEKWLKKNKMVKK